MQSERFSMNKPNTDALTGLCDAHAFAEQCDAILRQAQSEPCALVLVDLDYFTAFNARHGHMAGERALLGVAKRLRRLFDEQDVLARLNNDEFAVLMRDAFSPEMVRERLEALLLPDDALGITKSIGAALSPDDATDFDGLLQEAEAALRCAKRTRDAYALSDGLS